MENEDQAVEQSVEERMMDFLEAEEKQSEEPESEDEASAEAETNEESEEEGDEAEQPDEVQEEFTLSWNGETHRKTKEEVIALAQQGFDYTQKTQALAEVRKSFEAERAQAVESLQSQAQMQQQLADHIGEVKAIERQLAEWDKVDWQALIDADPVEAMKADRNYRTLQNQHQKAVQGYQYAAMQFEQARNANMQEVLSKEYNAMLAAIPEWGDSNKAESERQELRSFLMKEGFNEREIGSVADHRSIKIARKAMLYDKLMASKPQTEKRVEKAPKAVKSGVQVNHKAQKNKELRERFAKTGKEEYAAKLIESLL